MSKNHNYSQYSKKNKDNNPKVVEAAETVEPVAETEVIEPVVEPVVAAAEPEIVTEPVVETVDGVVVNCAKLNVRAEPAMTAQVLCVLNVTSELVINVPQSTNEWYKVCTATGVEGYCMRKFIEACL